MNRPIHLNRRHLMWGAGAGLAAQVIPTWTHAQGGLAVLVGSSPGSVPDLIARHFAERMGPLLGANVTVENKTGAAGQLAISALLSAGNDGSTLLLAPGGIATMYPAIYPRLAYVPTRDLQAVAPAAELSLGIGIGKKVPASVTTLRGFVAWARANNKQASVGSPGIGTPPHVLAALFASKAGLDLQHVPYRGGPPAMNDLLGGRLAAVVLPEGLLQRHADNGAVRLLATSGTRRSRFTPHTPTFTEQGLAGVVLHEWFGFFAAAAVAPERIATLSGAIGHAAGQADLIQAFAALNMSPATSSSAQMANRIATETTHWTPIIRAAGITATS